MPSLVSLSAGTGRVAFQANWDRDDTTLTYKVVRNSNTDDAGLHHDRRLDVLEPADASASPTPA